MKTYQVYAVGMAIVDYEFQLTSKADWPPEIEKGTTVLIDGQKEKAVLKSLAQFTPHQACGGTSANTLSVISGLGGRVFCSCKVAEDESGRLYHQNLRSHGIESNLDSSAKATGNTGRCLILIDTEGEKSLYTQLGANHSLTPADLKPAALQNSEYLFIETFLATLPSSKATITAALQMAKEFSCKIALTLTACKTPGFSPSRLADFTQHGLDLLFCNELEAAYFCETDDLETIKESLKKHARQFIITRGAKDTILFDGETFFAIPTYPTTAINTTGAGDAFAGAFLHALTTGRNFAQAGIIGNFAAAQVVKKAGARLDKQDLETLAAFMQASAPA